MPSVRLSVWPQRTLIGQTCWWHHVFVTGSHRTEEPGERSGEVCSFSHLPFIFITLLSESFKTLWNILNILHSNILLLCVFSIYNTSVIPEVFISRVLSSTGWKESEGNLDPEDTLAHPVPQVPPLHLDKFSLDQEGHKDQRGPLDPQENQGEMDHRCVFFRSSGREHAFKSVLKVLMLNPALISCLTFNEICPHSLFTGKEGW